VAPALEKGVRQDAARVVLAAGGVVADVALGGLTGIEHGGYPAVAVAARREELPACGR
jgi:hypothetical protein